MAAGLGVFCKIYKSISCIGAGKQAAVYARYRSLLRERTTVRQAIGAGSAADLLLRSYRPEPPACMACLCSLNSPKEKNTRPTQMMATARN